MSSRLIQYVGGVDDACPNDTICEVYLLKQITTVLLFCACLAAQIKSPERGVQANVITSERDPRV